MPPTTLEIVASSLLLASAFAVFWGVLPTLLPALFLLLSPARVFKKQAEARGETTKGLKVAALVITCTVVCAAYVVYDRGSWLLRLPGSSLSIPESGSPSPSQPTFSTQEPTAPASQSS